MTSLEAIHDALYLTDRITQLTASRTGDGSPGAADLEVHSLAYFASMLASWWDDDEPWGYGFYTTRDCEPFATDVSTALRTLKSRGALSDMGLLNSLTESGGALLREVSADGSFEPRPQYLDAALSTTQFISMPLVVQGIGLDPTLRASSASRPLLDDGAVAVISQYLDAARDMMGPNFSLRALAEIVLRYFIVSERKAEA